MTFKVVGWIAAFVLCACLPTQAQTYPTREIRVIVGLPAGSGGDVVARYYADKLQQLAGKPVIVENKPGMILSIGADAVAKASPDGYTILITSVTSSHAANVYNFKRLPYDPIKDFTPVAMLQKVQPRVQISPMIMKVAVPPEKHSPRFGQDASSQTLCSLCLRSSCLMRSTSAI